jgi:hypothetical protein
MYSSNSVSLLKDTTRVPLPTDIKATYFCLILWVSFQEQFISSHLIRNDSTTKPKHASRKNAMKTLNRHILSALVLPDVTTLKTLDDVSTSSYWGGYPGVTFWAINLAKLFQTLEYLYLSHSRSLAHAHP